MAPVRDSEIERRRQSIEVIVRAEALKFKCFASDESDSPGRVMAFVYYGEFTLLKVYGSLLRNVANDYTG